MVIFSGLASQAAHPFSLLFPSFLPNNPPFAHQPLRKPQKEDPLLFNFNPRSISNQQDYIGNHQNLLKEKKANFHSLYISVWDPLIDCCVNMGLKQEQ